MPMNTLEAWHKIVKSRDATVLGTLLADDVVFESPVVHKPQHGKAIATMYLNAALHVLNNESFVYRNEWKGQNSAVLEFESTVDGITINGVDMITWNAAGHISHFKVMVRPLKGMNKLHELMGAMLQKMAPPA
ncbi:MAG: nuclear transport factor 2 family protein [Rhodoferax sp.]|nr:nuclear transport factor 2 family protein [Rhodoferax sp.]